jgi:hypothetical protein
MSFEIDGFFSPELEQFRAGVRGTEPYKAWFDYALDLNRIGFDLLRQASSPATDPRLFGMHGHFVRAHQTFQSALLLAERGLVTDARTLVRSGVESAIALHALANDARFVDQMIEAHHLHRRRAARIVLDTPAYLAMYSSHEVAAMHATIAEADALETRLSPAAVANGATPPKKRKLQDIEWASTAMKHCPDLYQLLYRTTSTDGTHATVSTLNRFVETDETGRIVAFKIAPGTDGIVEALSAACLLFIWAAEPFAVVFDRPDVAEEMSKRVQQFAQLPGAFPRIAGTAA